MRIFLDTANIDEIRQAVRLGVISGVTTNPSLVAKEKHTNYKSAIQEICRLVPGPVSVEVMGQEAKAMVSEARELSTWHPQVVVKIPASPQGLEAISIISKEGIKANFTLCFSLNQAILGSLAGATYVSPFVGRLDDAGHDGMELVAEIVAAYQRYRIATQVIAASIRHPQHCLEAARVGAPIATVPYKVLLQMIGHPLTDAGIARFIQDWRQAQEK